MKIIISFLILLILLPIGFSWSAETHKNICRAVQDNIPDIYTDELLSGCVYPDELGDFTNHICHENYCPAYGRAYNFFKIARNYYIDKNMADASFNFGVACHYISDSVQPQHVEKAIGEEHIWFENIVVENVSINFRTDFFEAVNESGTYKDDISDFYKKDDKNGAYIIAEKFANYAAEICYDMIINEINNITKTDIPDCSSIKGLLHDDCNLMNVHIRGTLTNPIHRTSSAGNKYTIFYLSDGRERIKVFIWGDSGIPDGSGVSITGIFYKERVSGSYTFRDEIEASSVKEDSLSPQLIAILILVVIIGIVTIYVKTK